MGRDIDIGGSPRTISVLHVPYTWWPDPVGGTEIYVRDLVAEGRKLGIRGVVAVPVSGDRAATSDDEDIVRFPVPMESARSTVTELYGRGSRVAADAIAGLLDRLRPDVVHLHSRTRAASPMTVGACQARRIPVVFTYHTPTAGCPRGTLLLMGESVCDGRLEQDRCTACLFQAHGLPRWLSAMASRASHVASEIVGDRWAPRLPTAIRLSSLLEAQRSATLEFLEEVDAIVAPARWVVDVLARNGIDGEKVVFSRQGIPGDIAGDGQAASARADGTLRVACFARSSPEKGLDVLVEAVRRARDVPLQVSIYAVAQSVREERLLRVLSRSAGCDGRIRFLPPVERNAVLAAMREADVIAVPSRSLETGPLVVLEAFAATRPVIASRLGAMDEVVRDGIDGILFTPGSGAELGVALRRLASEPGFLEALREAIRPPRTMQTVAEEMNALYRKLAEA